MVIKNARGTARPLAMFAVITMIGGWPVAPATLGAESPTIAVTPDGNWQWEQVLQAPIEAGAETGVEASFAELFPSIRDGYPYFPAAIADAVTSPTTKATCSVTPTAAILFNESPAELPGTGSPCGDTSDAGSSDNGYGDYFIGGTCVVIPAEATSADFAVGNAGRMNEVHLMFGPPGAATYIGGGYSGVTVHTADLASLPTTNDGSRIAEMRVYVHDAAAGSGATARWRLDSDDPNDYVAIPASNVSTPEDCTDEPECEFEGARTLSQGGWGNRSASNPLTVSWFGTAFPEGLTIGGATNSIRFTDATSMRHFLPQSGTPAALTGGTVTNASRSLKNTLAGQAAALRLNLALSPNLAAATLVGSYNGFEGTLDDLLDEANEALDGFGSPTKAQLSTLTKTIDYVNTAFEGGIDAGRLTCESSPA